MKRSPQSIAKQRAAWQRNRDIEKRKLVLAVMLDAFTTSPGERAKMEPVFTKGLGLNKIPAGSRKRVKS